MPNTNMSRLQLLRRYAAQKAANVDAQSQLSSPANTRSLVVVPGPDPSNEEAVKYYVFNQTGNIMMSSTDLTSENITQSVRDVFNEVSVFFAAMTKAITTTINPATKKSYNLYDYTAISNVVDGSGLFIRVTEEDITYNSTSFGAQFSKEMIEALLGLATGSGELAFAQAMVTSLSSAYADISGSGSSSSSAVANIVFVCEYLLGMPIVSAIVVYAHISDLTQTIQLGPCFQETTTTITQNMHKDTYLFVTPKFISQFAGDLLSIETDETFNEFVSLLSSLVAQVPVIVSVNVGSTDTAAPNALQSNTPYTIIGTFFGETQGKVILGTEQLSINSWGNDTISFQAATAVSTPSQLKVFLASNTTTNPDVASSGNYTVGS